MNRRSRLVAALLTGLALVGCATDHTAPGPSSPAVADPSPLLDESEDPGDGEAVAAEAMRRIFTWRPALDTNPESALPRARDLLGPTLLAVLDRAAAAQATLVPPRRGLQWGQWTQERAWVDAQAWVSREREAPTDPDLDHLNRKVGIAQTVTWPNGRSEILPSTTVLAQLIHTAAGWRLDSYEVLK
ncbi:hypothetical protein [Antrihabitans stalactiti]|uniref:Mce-associated membrane protein n=1 Tax=Antrihabitans stalactiti TaxID=2584121 RepID=A0A848KMY4_9NOCA|nr:hypothetical protein [Antrihabitans stalactiti]NMN99308.1 hypothetical protein [Antrihabitans stalactiti]